MPNDKELMAGWNVKIQRGKEFRSRIYEDSQWRRFEGYFRNNFPGFGKEDEQLLPSRRRTIQRDNIIAREVRKMVPKVIFGMPYMRVRPLAGRLPIHAKVLERVINGILETILINDELRKLVLSTSQHGSGFLKGGFDSQFAPSYKEVLSVGFSSGAFNTKGIRQEFNDTIYPGTPWFKWQHPRGIVLPELMEDLKEARFVAFEYFRPLKDIKADSRFRNTSTLQPQNYAIAELDNNFYSDMPTFPIINDQVYLIEVRDKETGKMIIYSPNHDKILYKEDDVLMSILGGKLPLYPLVFNNNTDWGYGTSDVESMEYELKELIDLRTQRVKNRRLNVSKFFYREGSIEPEEMNRLTESTAQTGAGISVKGRPDDFIKTFTMPNQTELLVEEHDIERRVKEQLGGAAFGTHPSSRRGSAEVQGAQGDASIGLSERQGLVRQLLVEISKDIASMVFNFWTQETIVDILSPVTQTDPATGQKVDVTQKVWLAFKGNELRGNFDYYMAPTSGRFQDSQASKAEALELIKFFSQVPGVNPQELLRQLSDRFDGIDVDSLFTPINTPQNPLQMNNAQGLQRQSPNLNQQ